MNADEAYIRSLEIMAGYQARMSEIHHDDCMSRKERWVWDELKAAVLRYRGLIKSKNSLIDSK